MDRTSQITPDVGSIAQISSFGEDGSGNLYVVDYGGEVFRLTPQVVSADQSDTIDGGRGDDLIFGGSGDDALYGRIGNDELHGGNGADRLWGHDGDDVLLGDAGNDMLNGQTGTDTMTGGTGDDRYFVDNGGDLVLEKTGEGNDTVYASVDYRLAAGTAIEILRANVNTNLVLDGNQLANRIFGGGGNDLLRGFDGNDNLYGKDGNDRLNGGFGLDNLFGGAGTDTFIFTSAAAAGNGALRDQIRDFEDGVDRIDLRGFDVAFDFIGSAAFGGHAGELRAYQSGAHTLVAGDLDGNRTADFQILVRGLHSLSESDFLL